MKIVTVADIPDDLAEAWFHHMHEFDMKNPGCRFKSFAHAPNKSVDELKEILNVSSAAGGRSE
jgi:hypothetical protein